MTKIHKPTDPDELKRILDLGGSVFVGRVFGMLAVSRAFGDKDFKTPADFVSAEPAVDSIQLTPEHEYVAHYIRYMSCFSILGMTEHLLNTLLTYIVGNLHQVHCDRLRWSLGRGNIYGSCKCRTTDEGGQRNS